MSSSPMRKAKKRSSAIKKHLFWSAILCSPWVCCICYLLFIDYYGKASSQSLFLLKQQGQVELPQGQASDHHFANATSAFLASDFTNLQNSQNVPNEAIGAIIPVTSDSVLHLETVLLPLTNSSLGVSQIGIVCAQDALQRARTILRTGLFTSEDMNHAEFVLLPWAKGSSYVAAALAATSQMTTDRIVFLTVQGLKDADNQMWDLFSSSAFSLPYGPRGFISSDRVACLIPQKTAQPASFLVPPFVVPYSVFRGVGQTHDLTTWIAFGVAVAKWIGHGVGGIVLAAEEATSWCPEVSSKISAAQAILSSPVIVEQDILHRKDSVQISDWMLPNNVTVSSGIITLFLPDSNDLRDFSGTICRLQANGTQIRIFLYKHNLGRGIRSESYAASDTCHLTYQTRHHGDPLQTVASWLRRIEFVPHIVVTIKEDDPFTRAVSISLSSRLYTHSTLIRLPRRDLKHCEWMGSLTIPELRNWHIPRVDITVITNDRPHSLVRLLTSLTNARYFGDIINLRINLEQDTGPDTMRIVDKLQWGQGAIFVNHRVIHGGLLPAVVESWYPHTDDSYGLILEDDVELSPFFYAWIKMTLLRYRYGKEENKSTRLFGISLYQQKNIETKPDGRQPFNARTIFASEHIASYNTPYLSQIPCSWGAIYFPEHWREFHSYLAIRLSELSISIDQVVVPNTRSNRWTKSWKKYFIELVFLRGYVMLYPNYDHFVSLSTNHLEVGSHVKDTPRDSYLQKKDMFLVPLIPLSEEGLSMLLDLPEGHLPAYSSLPTLDLFGDIASSASLVQRGLSRQAVVIPLCTNKITPRITMAHDVHGLLCLGESL